MSERRWRNSLYWRIAIGVIAVILFVLVAQAGIVIFVLSRADDLPLRSLREMSALVATDLERALRADPALDVERFLTERPDAVDRVIVAIFDDGRIVSTDRNLPPRFMEEMRQRAGVRARRGSRRDPRLPAGEARRGPMGMTRFDAASGRSGRVVVLPSRPFQLVASRYGPTLAVIAAGLAIGGTLLASLLIFRPAHRRLRGLEEAARRLGAGETGTRAEEGGGDEIAAVARAFNRMAGDLARRAEQVETADRLRRQLFADVSHELSTPLTAIRGYLETLRMQDLTLDEASRTRYLGIVHEETLRLDRLVGDLLELARLEAGGGALDRVEVEVRALFERVAARHERSAEERGVAFNWQVDAGAATVVADPLRLEQALQNLAANALRHTPPGGRIELSASREHATIVLRVRDSGEGIAPDHLPHVFDRFYKADAARHGSGNGSGLGLSIVKAIAERHGGSVGARSTPGVETVFEIRLPRE